MQPQFLPISREDLAERGWSQLDFIIVSGDAYVDHASFGAPIIGRLLEANGYKVGIIPQPNWRDLEQFRVLGRPRLGFLVTGGNLDSMVNHYTVARRRRRHDAYSPGGKTGLRPDRASIVYANRIREAYRRVPIILGGLEASLRRLAHYDYWADGIRRSVLLDANADLLVYGMGERQIVEIADGLNAGISIKHLNYIKGTVFKTSSIEHLVDPVFLPSFEEIASSKTAFAESFRIQHNNTDPITGKVLVEKYPRASYIVQNPPADSLSTYELDSVYLLPFTRQAHPIYDKSGGVPGFNEVKFSLVSSRGCFGGCSFCALTFHQGRTIQKRSKEAIIEEAKELIKEPDFKGYIHDVGGPTANFRNPACAKQASDGVCSERECLYPRPCGNLEIDHQDYLDLLRQLRTLPEVKRVFVRSGIRYDYLIYDPDKEFFKEMCEHHVSGQLKVAPEHISPTVLKKMGKPGVHVYQRFVREFNKINQELGKEQYLVPYFMSSHPGSRLEDAIELAEYIRDMGYNPEQVQDFYPTPGTLATCMYYTELDPLTGDSIYVAKTPHEKAMQRALIQFRNPRNRKLVQEALIKAGREDLIGHDTKSLIRP